MPFHPKWNWTRMIQIKLDVEIVAQRFDLVQIGLKLTITCVIFGCYLLVTQLHILLLVVKKTQINSLHCLVLLSVIRVGYSNLRELKFLGDWNFCLQVMMVPTPSNFLLCGFSHFRRKVGVKEAHKVWPFVLMMIDKCLVYQVEEQKIVAVDC